MLKHILLRNFKVFRKLDLDIAPVTVLIGPNGTGKSSVLQALALLRQSLGQGQLRTSADLVDLGTPMELVHGEHADGLIHLGVAVGGGPKEGAYGQFQMSYEASFLDNGALSCHEAHLRWDGLKADAYGSYQQGVTLEPAQLPLPECIVQLGGGMEIGRPMRLEGLAEAKVTGEEVLASLRRRIALVVESVADTLNHMFFVPAIRGFDSPVYPLQPGSAEDLGGFRLASSQAERVVSTLIYRDELEAVLSRWMKRVTGAAVHVDLQPGPNLHVKGRVAGSEVNIVNEGFATNQLIRLLLPLALAERGSVVAVEEPEIHLHPAAQGKLADVFVEVAREKGIRFLLTTHSEHLLLAFLRHVAAGHLRPDDVAIYYFERRGRRASATRLRVDERGSVTGGMRGFFEVGLAELKGFLAVGNRGLK